MWRGEAVGRPTSCGPRGVVAIISGCIVLNLRAGCAHMSYNMFKPPQSNIKGARYSPGNDLYVCALVKAPPVKGSVGFPQALKRPSLVKQNQ